MKKTFDRMIGPEGEWIEDDGAEKSDAAGADGLSGRDEFAFRCLNAAANLYGVVTVAEMAAIYNHYAAGHGSPVSGLMGEDELLTIAERLLSEELDDTWFSVWFDDRKGFRYIVYNDLTAIDHPPGEEPPPEEAARIINKRIANTLEDFCAVDLKMPEESSFFCYEDPMGDEETPESEKLAKFLKKEYHVAKLDADLAVMDIQSEFRINGDSLANALEYVRDECEFSPKDQNGVRRLLDALAPVASTTRTWNYRGHTAREMSALGFVSRLATEEIPDVFDFEEDIDADRDDDDWDDEDGEPIRAEELPPAEYTGPIDFRRVKDPAWRDKALFDYDGVRIVTKDFVRHVVMHELTQDERRDAAKRLGIETNPKTGLVLDSNLDMVVGDFAAMMDDQHGEPAIKRILKRKNELGEFDRLAAGYFENYRYTWLEVQAVKSGVGVKCRDLLTGDDLFLMEKSFSTGNVKGMTVCAGIAPMGEVFLSLGVISPANFENPATILKIVLAHLGIPSDIPVRLSFADQARLAAESIRRIRAAGRFDTVEYGDFS